jgi:hypothetical protein
MPDYYIYKAPTCACGDDPVRIPPARRDEGLEDKAHWCTGTLRMTDGFGNAKYILNTMTYGQLRSALKGKIEPYLECISMRGQLGAAVDSEENEEMLTSESVEERCDELKPKVTLLDEQQVSPIAVLERCKSNYQQKQWDVGAFLLYDRERMLQEVSLSILSIPTMPESDNVGRCLLRAEKNKESNLGCMQDYLDSKHDSESKSAIYWRYEKVHLTQSSAAAAEKPSSSSTDDTDACIVFSGPAKKQDNSSTTLEFRKCSHDHTETGCIIPHMVWSSSSGNRVPVATMHAVEELNAEDRIEAALAMFEEARSMAMSALKRLENFTDANLEVVLFSGEGDALHQIFDCIVMGPLARVDFWDRCVFLCTVEYDSFALQLGSRHALSAYFIHFPTRFSACTVCIFHLLSNKFQCTHCLHILLTFQLVSRHAQSATAEARTHVLAACNVLGKMVLL